MQKLREKLHSHSGASMLMALLLMLVGLMVSAVIIAAAGSAAVSIRGERAQQQAYLTVSSAAELMRDELESGNCTYKTTVVTTYKDAKRNNQYGNPETTTTEGTSIFYSVLEDALEKVRTYSGSTFRETYTFSTEGLDDVTAEVLLKADTDSDGNTVYRLTVWFEGGDAPNQCRVCLTMDGIESTNSTTGQETVKESTNNWWESNGGDWVQTQRGGWTYKYWKYVTYYTVTETTSIEWKNANIQKKEVQPNA